jgi:cysteine-rich repeat protein
MASRRGARAPRGRVLPIVVAAAMGVLGMCADARAQTVTTAPFVVATSASGVDVAATFAGTYLVYAHASATLFLQRIAPTGAFDPRVVVEAPSRALRPAIAPLGTGGFTVVWRDNTVIDARFLDVLGALDGSTFQESQTLANGFPAVATVASGAAVVWSEATPTGIRLHAQVGLQRHVLDGAPLEWDVASTPDGGCVVVWRYLLGGGTYGMRVQRFSGSGALAGDAHEIGLGDLISSGIAVDPTSGTLAVVGVLPTTTDHFEVRAMRFGSDGTPIGSAIVVDHTMETPGQVPSSVLPRAAFDYGGDLYVVWADHAEATTGVRARAFAPDGVPLGPSSTLAPDVLRDPVRTVLGADGRFVNAWSAGATVKASVVSLCVPGTTACGDGVRVGACERCDDGAANDDHAPDACRSTCVPAHCGDGVVDTGEQCDDGNFTPCDGCSPSCTSEALVVCGDGVTVRACGEECDDGNAALLDGCTPACRLERIPGGGSPKTDCLSEWVIDNPTTVPPYDKRGAINPKQSCRDGDPRCDFGGVPGSCTFHVRVCGNDTNVPGCVASDRLASWVVERPTLTQAAKQPWMATLRDALDGTVPGAIIGPAVPDVCSDVVAVTVPLRAAPSGSKAGRVKLQSRAADYAGRIDKDKLALECRPAP